MFKENKKIKLYTVSGGIIALALVIGLFGNNKSKDEDILWREYFVTKGDIVASLDGSGKVKTSDFAYKAKVDVVIDEILKEKGDMVYKDDLILHYDEVELQKQYKIQEDKLNKAKMELENAQNNKTIYLLENELSASQETTGSARTFKKQKDELQKNINTIEAEIQQLNREKEALKLQLDKAEDSVDGNVEEQESAQMRKLKRQLEKLNDALNDLINSGVKASISDDSYIKSLRKEIDVLNGEISALKITIDDLNAHQAKREALKATILEIENKLNNSSLTQDEIDAFSVELAAKKGELNKVSDMASELANSTTQKESLADEKKLLDKALSDLEKQDAQSEAVRKLREQIKEIEAQLQYLKSKEGAVGELQESIEKNYKAMEEANRKLKVTKEDLFYLEGEYVNNQSIDANSSEIKAQISALKLASLENNIESANDGIKRAEEEFKSIKALIDNPYLVASEDGIIMNINVSLKQEVSVGSNLVSLSINNGKIISVQVAQEDISQIAEGQESQLQFIAFGDSTINGRVIGKSYVPSDGLDGVYYEVRILIEDNDYELLQGMTCSVRFILKKVENVLYLSNKAITLKDGKQYVKVKRENNDIEEVLITTGFSDGRVSEIKKGLSENDVVVKEG